MGRVRRPSRIATPYVRLALCVTIALTAGCSVPPEPALLEDLEAEALETRLAAITGLQDIDSPESTIGLLESFTDDPEARGANSVALVLKGRRWYVENSKPGLLENPVITGMAPIVKRGTLDADLRCKGVWVMAEVTQPLPPGSKIRRDVEAYINAADAGDSTLVGKEKAISRNKMGFTSKGHPYECLGPDELHPGYNPAARGHLPKEES